MPHGFLNKWHHRNRASMSFHILDSGSKQPNYTNAVMCCSMFFHWNVSKSHQRSVHNKWRHTKMHSTLLQCVLSHNFSCTSARWSYYYWHRRGSAKGMQVFCALQAVCAFLHLTNVNLTYSLLKRRSMAKAKFGYTSVYLLWSVFTQQPDKAPLSVDGIL